MVKSRRSIIEIAKHDGIPVRETSLRPEALMGAAEVFLTGTTAGVWPVSAIDGHKIANGEPGPVTLRLRRRLHEITSGSDPAFAHWLALVDEA